MLLSHATKKGWFIMAKYLCTVCQWVYDEEKEGTKFADLAEDWTCPICGVEKDMFELVS